MNYKIAIVEDDPLIQQLIRLNLNRQQFSTFCFHTGESFLDQTKKESFDLLILDLSLPGLDGHSILEIIKSRKIHIPVLILTVQHDVEDKLRLFHMGADDYVTKPFNMEELIARVHALIRRSTGKRLIPSHHVIQINQYNINLSTRECDSNTGMITLSEKETQLLKYFASNPHQTLNRADILEEVWGMDVSPTPRTIDNFILKFRKLFESNPESPKHFISIRNRGYRFEG